MTEEVTIAGGGLAGLALAVGLRRSGVPVTVHEAGRYPRHRVCGEFVSGVGAATLEKLGIGEDLADAGRHESGIWFREGRRLLEMELPEAALGISRYRLDKRLRDRVLALEGRVIEGSRRPRIPTEGMVWAAGRIPRKGGWLGLKCHVEGLKLSHGLEMHLGRNGYAGLTPVEDGRVNVCGLFHLDRARSGEGSRLLLDYLRAGGCGDLADRLAAARVDEDSFLGVAGFELGWQEEAAGLCTVGDAVGMIPPFTGNGMSMAFESAESALDPLVGWSRGKVGWERVVSEIRRSHRERFKRRVAVGQALHRVLLHERGQRLIEALSKLGVLPFRPMLSLVR